MNRQRPSSISKHQRLNELLDELTRIDCDPVIKESYRRRLELLLKDGNATPGDGLFETKIRDARREIEQLKARALTGAEPQSPAGVSTSPNSTHDLSRYAGVIELHEDPLAYQSRIRGEWS
jgi:hypothetical protein